MQKDQFELIQDNSLLVLRVKSEYDFCLNLHFLMNLRKVVYGIVDFKIQIFHS
jgi:hypothetical protein